VPLCFLLMQQPMIFARNSRNLIKVKRCVREVKTEFLKGTYVLYGRMIDLKRWGCCLCNWECRARVKVAELIGGGKLTFKRNAIGDFSRAPHSSQKEVAQLMENEVRKHLVLREASDRQDVRRISCKKNSAGSQQTRQRTGNHFLSFKSSCTQERLAIDGRLENTVLLKNFTKGEGWRDLRSPCD
jgi:hypothetical protein